MELVPETCWYSNVRSLVDKAGWDRIRRKVYRQCGYRCEVCGGRGPEHPVEAHEIWAYDDEAKIQTLAGMIGLCPACHEVKHLGLAGVRGRGETALRHLAAVNGWSLTTARQYAAEAFQVWQERSEHLWTLVLDGLAPYVTAREFEAACVAADQERAAQLADWDDDQGDQDGDDAPGVTVRALTDQQLEDLLQAQAEQGESGVWGGSGATALGLTGPATPDQVREVFRGDLPAGYAAWAVPPPSRGSRLAGLGLTLLFLVIPAAFILFAVFPEQHLIGVSVLLGGGLLSAWLLGFVRPAR